MSALRRGATSVSTGGRRNRHYDPKAFGVREHPHKRLVAWQESVNDPVLKLDAGRPIEMGPPAGQ